MRTVRRCAASERLPCHIGIGLTGCGSIVMSLTTAGMCFASKETGSCDHTARIIAMPSSMRRPRSLNGTPSAANSGSSQPTPTPRISRPPDKLCNVDNSLASGSGWRIGRTITLVPSRTRSVTAATPGQGEDRIIEQGRARKLRARHDDVLADPDVAEAERLGALGVALDQYRRCLAAGVRQVHPDLHRSLFSRTLTGSA